MKPPLVVGNWKMHGTQTEASALARQVRRGFGGITSVEVALAPPFTALVCVGQVIKRSSIRLAAQNMHWELEGAFTGEVSPKMLRELDCSHVIIGHSERRYLFNEDDQTVAKKMISSLRNGLSPILCVGETIQQRRTGKTKKVIARQLQGALKEIRKSGIGKIAIAYEPVWAIGTGHNATLAQVNEVHRWIRECLKDLWSQNSSERCRILYGGSVRPDNAAELAQSPQVNGLLVGGASLKAESFLSIIRCFVR
jgi:triosephosphate isomerase